VIRVKLATAWEISDVIFVLLHWDICPYFNSECLKVVHLKVFIDSPTNQVVSRDTCRKIPGLAVEGWRADFLNSNAELCNAFGRFKRENGIIFA
jgi:hypothetical protein